MLDQLPAVRLHHDRRRRRGGEYDELRALDRHTVRRLVGARFIHPAGSPPDELAECWNDLFGTELQTCDVIRRWSRDCLEHIEERQRAARARREANLVRRAGVPSLWAWRVRRAQEAGFPSYRAMRRARGWPG